MEKSNNNTLNVGIIGLGVGEAHIEGFESHPQCKVRKICDFNQEKLSEVARKYPHLECVSDAEQILKDPNLQIVSIASYDNFHCEQILQAIEHEKHVFVEKPLCLSEKEITSIREAFNKKPHLALSSNLILRKSPRFISLKEKVQKNDFGKVYFLDGDYNYGRIHKITSGWRGDIDFYSVLFGGAIHLVDLFQWILNEDIEEVSSAGNQIVTKGSQFQYDDFAVSLLRFKSGKIAKISSNYSCVYPHFHKISLYGESLTFENDITGGRLFHSSSPDSEVELMKEGYKTMKKGDLLYSFIEGILDNEEGEVTKDDVFKVMSVCLAMEKSKSSKKFLKVQYY